MLRELHSDEAADQDRDVELAEHRLGGAKRVCARRHRRDVAGYAAALERFDVGGGKRITFEYVMFAGFNDSLDDAERLLGLLKGIRAKVNLIPYNDNPDRELRRPTDDVVKAFQDFLVTHGLSTSVRTTRGIDISAACGQLGKTRQQVDSGSLQVPPSS